MPSKLQTLVQHAKKTFLKPIDKTALDNEKFDALVLLTNDLCMGDVNLPARLCGRNGRIPDKVDYLSIHGDEHVSIGVFVIEQDAKIPIHDHPGMHGLLKVLHGELEITTYNVVNPNPVSARRKNQFFYKNPLEVIASQSMRVKPSDPCSQLTPDVNNIHEVRCTTGPAAFLDILAPPYDDSEDAGEPKACHYFKEVSEDGHKTKLVQTTATEAWP